MGACKGQYGCMRGSIWVHASADMGSHEQAVIGLDYQQYQPR